jgi:hypothetical protein
MDQGKQLVVSQPYRGFEGKWETGLTKRTSFQKSREHRDQQFPQNIQIPILRGRRMLHPPEQGLGGCSRADFSPNPITTQTNGSKPA